MTADIVELIPAVLRARGFTTLDLTGGAPELHPQFRQLVREARALGVKVIDRCNLTILNEPGQAGLTEFLAAQSVTVVASMPCYEASNVDQQRGDGVFDRSIDGLRQLNALGYGLPDSGLVLDLVFNPQGPVLPPPQAQLEKIYREELFDRFGIQFNRLFVLANMPIQRFAAVLQQQGKYDSYLELLRQHHNPDNLPKVMCRTLISVDWQGYLYDCDFNQMLGQVAGNQSPRPHLRHLLLRDPVGNRIATGVHCFGCTSGSGSSCSGALS